MLVFKERWGGALPLWSSGWESMVQGIPVHGATTPVCHNYWALALEPVKCNYWANEPQLLKPAHPATSEACAVQQEKSLQWEVSAPQRESSPCLPQLEKTHVHQQRHSAARYKERKISECNMGSSRQGQSSEWCGSSEMHSKKELWSGPD